MLLAFTDDFSKQRCNASKVLLAQKIGNRTERFKCRNRGRKYTEKKLGKFRKEAKEVAWWEKRRRAEKPVIINKYKSSSIAEVATTVKHVGRIKRASYAYKIMLGKPFDDQERYGGKN